MQFNEITGIIWQVNSVEWMKIAENWHCQSENLLVIKRSASVLCLWWIYVKYLPHRMTYSGWYHFHTDYLVIDWYILVFWYRSQYQIRHHRFYCTRFAGKTASGSCLLLVSLHRSSDPEVQSKLVVNCEKMVIGSMIFKLIKEKLTAWISNWFGVTGNACCCLCSSIV